MKRIRVFINERGTHALPTNLSDLPSVELVCTSETTLYELGELASDQLGVALQSPSLLFMTSPDSEGARNPASYPRALVGTEGSLRWPTEGARSITVGDLERTSAEGLFSADPSAFVYEESTIGDSGLVLVWHEFLEWLAQIESSGGGAILLWEAARRLKALLERHYKQWRGKGARTPSSLFEVILSQQEWHPSRLARLLGLSKEEGEELLEALGYEEEHGGVCRISQDPEKAALREQLWKNVIEYDPHSWKRPIITVEGADYDADYEPDED